MSSPESRPTARRSIPRNVLTLCLLVVLGIGVAGLVVEGAVRLLVPVSDFFYQWDPVVGLKLIPNKRGRFVKRGIFDTRVEINSHGFRDREHAYKKPPGVQRVVLLGDSFIEALQVPFEQSITPLLEARVNATGLTTEFINLGVSGFGTGREYLMLREYGLRYQPDLVVLFFVGNDVSDNSKRLQGLPYVPYPVPSADGTVARDEVGQLRFTPFADQSSRLAFLTRFLRDHTKSFRLLRESIDAAPALHSLLYKALRLVSTPPEAVNVPGNKTFGFHEIYRPQYTPAWSEAWMLTESLLLATRTLVEANGAKFAVVIVPAAWEVYPEHWESILTSVPAMREASLDLDKPSRELASFLAANGIPHVALLRDFRERAAGLPPLYVRADAHWTADGHRLATDLLSRPIVTLLTETSPANLAVTDRN